MRKAVSMIAIVGALALGATQVMAQGAGGGGGGGGGGGAGGGAGGGGGGPENSDRGGQGANSAMGAKNTTTPSSTGIPQKK